MFYPISRREFSTKAAAGAIALLSWSVDSRRSCASDDNPPDSNRLISLGLNALSRSPDRDYFADGHRGASLIAAQLLCDENKLESSTRTRIVELFDLNWAATPLCQPFPEEEPDFAQVRRIAEALLEGAEVLRQVGHNVIFAMLAIKAFRQAPHLATPKRIDGVCKLIRSFTPWHDVPPDPSIDPPPFQESVAASRFVLREALSAIDRFDGYGQGFAGHMLTFGQALVELAAMGDVELAESCRTAFRKYVTVTRQGPDAKARRIPEHKPSALRPKDSKYWQMRGETTLGIGHVFKYPYSYYDLLRRANDAELQRSWDEKAYRIF